MSTHRQVARPRVYVWPKGAGATTGESIADFVDLSPFVERLQVGKGLHEPVGTFELSLVPDPGAVGGPQNMRFVDRLYRLIQLGSVVSIGFEEDGGIMVGLVTGRHRVRARAGDTTQYGIHLAGADLARILTQDSVVHASLGVPTLPVFLAKLSVVLGPDHPLIKALPGTWGPLTGPEGAEEVWVPSFLGQSVANALDWILDNAPSMRIPVLDRSIGGSGLPGSFIRTDRSVTTWNEARLNSDHPQSYQGNLWGFLLSVLDQDFYEIWIDTSPNGTTLPDVELIVRPKPFDEPELNFGRVSERTGSEWPALVTRLDGLQHHEVLEDEVLSERLGVSDANVYSYYQVTSENELIGNAEAAQEGLMYPLVDTYSLVRFGLRDYTTQSALISGDIREKAAGGTDFDGEVILEVRELRNRLFNWYRLNPFFEAGELQVRGRDRFRPGDPVFCEWLEPELADPITGIPQKGVRFYCTKVSWSWQFGQAYTSTLELSRGHNDSTVRAAKAIILAEGVKVGNPDHFAES